MPDTSGFKKDTVGSYIVKDPGAYLTYTVDWVDWLPGGDNLDTSTFTASTISGDASPLVIAANTIITTQAVVEISGGTAGEIYTVTNTITTTNGETDKRRFRIKVEDRYL